MDPDRRAGQHRARLPRVVAHRDGDLELAVQVGHPLRSRALVADADLGERRDGERVDGRSWLGAGAGDVHQIPETVPEDRLHHLAPRAVPGAEHEHGSLHRSLLRRASRLRSSCSSTVWSPRPLIVPAG